MHIKHIELSNFRKLLAVRIDLADETTLFVGANNSGKTSAMLAMRRFLTARGRKFETHDITLCHWGGINALGNAWLAGRGGDAPPDLAVRLHGRLSALDLWLTVSPRELHHVSKLVPLLLDWAGGLLGIRLRLRTSGRSVAVQRIPGRHRSDRDYESGRRRSKKSCREGKPS